MLNLATRAYVDEDIKIDIIGQDIAHARDEIRAGKGIPAEELYQRLGIKR